MNEVISQTLIEMAENQRVMLKALSALIDKVNILNDKVNYLSGRPEEDIFEVPKNK